MEIIQINVDGFDNNFSYLIVGKNSETIIIDPTGNKEKILKIIREKNLKLVLQLITHSHPDHVELVEYFEKEGVVLKNFLELKKQKDFLIAGLKIKTIFTPGHTLDSVCFLIENNIFTGDTLFVRGVGTTNYGGNELQLKKTLKGLFNLDQNIVVWPGHDYGGKKNLLSACLKNSNILPSKEKIEELRNKKNLFEKNLKKNNFEGNKKI